MNSIKPSWFNTKINRKRWNQMIWDEIATALTQGEYFEWKQSYYQFTKDQATDNANLWNQENSKIKVLDSISTCIKSNTKLSNEEKNIRGKINNEEKNDIFEIIQQAHKIKKEWEELGLYRIASLKAKIRKLMKIRDIKNDLWFLSLFLLEWVF